MTMQKIMVCKGGGGGGGGGSLKIITLECCNDCIYNSAKI